MIATIHHMPIAWAVTMTDPHSEDWLRLQGQIPGEHHLLRWDSMGTQVGGEDCPGLWGQISATKAKAGITCGGIGMAKIAIPSRNFVRSLL